MGQGTKHTVSIAEDTRQAIETAPDAGGIW